RPGQAAGERWRRRGSRRRPSPGRSCQLLGGPDRQLFAKDLGVVANIHRERRVEENGRYRARQRVGGPAREQLLAQRFFFHRRSAWVALHTEHRKHFAFASDTDEGRAFHGRVSIENALARDGEEGAVPGDDALGLAATEPDTLLLIDVAHIA